MKFRLIMLLLALTMILSSCSWPDGSYHSVTPHQEQSGSIRTENLTVRNYDELLEAMEAVVSKGTESCVINVVNYDPDQLEKDLSGAVYHIRRLYPVGAYAVEDVRYEVGSNTGKTAVAMNVDYRRSRMEIQKIKKAKDAEDVRNRIGAAMNALEVVLVIQMEDYAQLDVTQIVQEYARLNPQTVMEVPQVTSEVYGIGEARILELTFSYQTSREALRAMQSQVKPVFDSAALYVSGEGAENQKFSQLYAFLMERFEYKVETSVTPSYSLLRHGVGDSRAFAMVYAAMCRGAELECLVVTGTRSGEPWTWNIIREDGYYWHVDLLHSSEYGQITKKSDAEMDGYVWDYSAYPLCDYVKASEELIPEEK